MTTMSAQPGSLSRPEQMRFARAAVAAQIKSLPGTLRAQLRRVDSSALARESAPPDSALARDAERFVAEHYTTSLYNHCLRCWYFGDFFAQLEGHRYDPELLYISSLFHDIALTRQFRDQRPYACFAVEGADLAKAWLARNNADDALAANVAEVIAAHMDVHVPVGSGAGIETYLLHEAAHLDVAGTRASQVPSSYTRLVAGRHPRTGFARAFSDAMKYESLQRKASRAAVLWKVGMAIPINTNPLDSAAHQ
ncbi:HD domain-containing protein [Mycobacteroides abscessus]|uniref:HD domain-containing protein n=1 Tax=Mycobacteroides abscessus TaxID=36809 RepID=UPI000C269CCB|nr:HD domain-containing protein [Mycobacteroides abscessus]